MTETPAPPRRDRLAAFLEAFDLAVVDVTRTPGPEPVHLVVVGPQQRPERVRLHAFARPAQDPDLLGAARVAFGGPGNPLLAALPETLDIDLADHPALGDLARAFVAECSGARCGRRHALNKLSELIVLHALRLAIEQAPATPGLLAALSHPTLQRAVVAMHDDPAAPWRVEDLAALAGLSRSRFMTLFGAVMGVTPHAYLTAWRMARARRALEDGASVKSAARSVGFGAAEAFSRAYARAYGHPPRAARTGGRRRPDAVQDR